jgi:hypothetical protein
VVATGSADNTIFGSLGLNGPILVVCFILATLSIKRCLGKTTEFSHYEITREFDEIET